MVVVREEDVFAVVLVDVGRLLAGHCTGSILEIFECADEKWLGFVIKVEL